MRPHKKQTTRRPIFSLALVAAGVLVALPALAMDVTPGGLSDGNRFDDLARRLMQENQKRQDPTADSGTDHVKEFMQQLQRAQQRQQQQQSASDSHKNRILELVRQVEERAQQELQQNPLLQSDRNPAQELMQQLRRAQQEQERQHQAALEFERADLEALVRQLQQAQQQQHQNPVLELGKNQLVELMRQTRRAEQEQKEKEEFKRILGQLDVRISQAVDDLLPKPQQPQPGGFLGGSPAIDRLAELVRQQHQEEQERARAQQQLRQIEQLVHEVQVHKQQIQALLHQQQQGQQCSCSPRAGAAPSGDGRATQPAARLPNSGFSVPAPIANSGGGFDLSRPGNSPGASGPTTRIPAGRPVNLNERGAPASGTTTPVQITGKARVGDAAPGGQRIPVLPVPLSTGRSLQSNPN